MTANTGNKTGAILGMLFVVTVWGSASTVTKIAVEEVPPYLFAFLRNALASVCMLPLYFSRRRLPEIKQQRLPYFRLFCMGLTGITLFYIFFNQGLVFTSAATGALIQGFIPVAIILLAVAFLKEKIRLLQVTGILLSVTGVLFIGFVGSNDAGGSMLGNVLIIGAVIVWGVYTILAKSVQSIDAVVVTTFTIFIGTLLLIPVTVYENWNQPMPAITWKAWLAIAYLGIFSSCICYILYSRALKVLPAVQVGNFMNLDPVMGAIIAVIVLQDKLTGWQILGTVLVLVGIVLSSRVPTDNTD